MIVAKDTHHVLYRKDPEPAVIPVDDFLSSLPQVDVAATNGHAETPRSPEGVSACPVYIS